MRATLAGNWESTAIASDHNVEPVSKTTANVLVLPLI
jgi:hypothetical protein